MQKMWVGAVYGSPAQGNKAGVITIVHKKPGLACRLFNIPLCPSTRDLIRRPRPYYSAGPTTRRTSAYHTTHCITKLWLSPASPTIHMLLTQIRSYLYMDRLFVELGLRVFSGGGNVLLYNTCPEEKLGS